MRIEIKEKELFAKIINKKFELKINSSKIGSICTDSRLLKKNDIYIPIKGATYDGHEFITKDLKNKSLITFSERPDISKTINVSSTKLLLKELSEEWLCFFKKPIIALTGSNGKTSTKELLKNIFESKNKVNCTIGNYNSTIGLPMNLFSFSLGSYPQIIEMGANQKNEINYLCQIAKPDYSLVTNIQNAHIGNFNSMNDLIDTKTSIFRNTNEDGYIFENNDDKQIAEYCKNINNKIQFGFKNRKLDFFGEYNVDSSIPNFYINGKRIFNKDLNSIMAKNMLSAYSIASVYGISDSNITEALANFKFPKGRGNKIFKNGYCIIDDTYNANLDSFKIGIDNFLLNKSNGKKFMIIGDMKELGDKSFGHHLELGEFIAKKNIDYVLGYGNEIEITINAITNDTIFTKMFKNNEEIINFLKKQICKGDFLYFKASRSLKFENIIKEL